MFDNTNLWRLEMLCALICAIGFIAQSGVGWGQSDRLELPVLFQTTSIANSAGQPLPRIIVQPPPGEYSPAAGWSVEMKPSERGSNQSKLIIRVPSNIDEIEIVPVHQLDMSSIARVTIDYPSLTGNQINQVAENQPFNKMSGISELDRTMTNASHLDPPANFEESIPDSVSHGNHRLVKNPFFKPSSAAPVNHLSSSRDQPLLTAPRLNLPIKPLPDYQSERKSVPTIDPADPLELPKKMDQNDETSVRVQFYDEDAFNSSAKSEDRQLKFDSAISPASFLNPSSETASPTRGVAPIIVNFFDE